VNKKGVMGNKLGFTLFAVPKSFEDSHITMVQNNAIQSWRELGSQVEVILCGNDSGVAEAAERFGCLHIADVECVESGQPYLNNVVAEAQALASHDVVVYLSADIILFQDFAVAVDKAGKFFAGSFVMVGARWDWARPVEVEFDEGWPMRVRALAKRAGHKHNDYGMDYFVFRRGVFDDMKPFIIGWYAWDNALILDVVRRKIPLVNVTRDVFVVHQKHPERIKNRGKRGTAWQRIWNLDLAGGLEALRVGGGGHIGRSDWRLKDGRIERTRAG
jgi:hypothetical protein